MNHALADQLQIWGFEGDMIVFSDGSLGFGLDCVPVDLNCWSDDRINSYSERVGQFFNSLPDKIDIQFIQEIDSGNNMVIENHQRLGDGSKNPIAKALCSVRVDRLMAEDGLGNLPYHGLKVFVRRPFSQVLLDKPKLFSKEKQFSTISEERLEREIQLTERLRDNVAQGLTSLDIRVNAMTSDQIAKVLYHQWNPSRRVPFQSYDPEEVRQSLLYSDVGVTLSGFVIGTTNFRVLSLKNLPDQTYD